MTSFGSKKNGFKEHKSEEEINNKETSLSKKEKELDKLKVDMEKEEKEVEDQTAENEESIKKVKIELENKQKVIEDMENNTAVGAIGSAAVLGGGYGIYRIIRRKKTS